MDGQLASLQYYDFFFICLDILACSEKSPRLSLFIYIYLARKYLTFGS